MAEMPRSPTSLSPRTMLLFGFGLAAVLLDRYLPEAAGTVLMAVSLMHIADCHLTH
ncbi:hypothetical protein Afil01_69220 [Actinorhabdospora filicis]|uniref:Uncharacterized protein n=1 Tax=Actinorhabdospora filicis TaxID=1785913 RepID=A0A9W6WER5_9ACTN|nr:hypothetical protein [Actinorhabdospora filicis]GLZ82115.1 hypothetical protein Afil01_69220 [Actinorhabdospora filicis]